MPVYSNLHVQSCLETSCRPDPTARQYMFRRVRTYWDSLPQLTKVIPLRLAFSVRQIDLSTPCAYPTHDVGDPHCEYGMQSAPLPGAEGPALNSAPAQRTNDREAHERRLSSNSPIIRHTHVTATVCILELY